MDISVFKIELHKGILINGNNIVNHSEFSGSFLIAFHGTTTINNVLYTILGNNILGFK